MRSTITRSLVLCGAALLASAAAACGDDPSPAPSSSGAAGSSSGDTSGETEGPDASAADSGETENPIGAPEITDVMKMAGSLHVVWDLPSETKCDSIEGERKTETEPYAVAWTVRGSLDNKHDSEATENTTYTYRVRCKVGAAYSDYSNELGKNPTR
jgi:hypothetical protein